MTFEHKKPHFLPLIYRPALFEFQSRLLALRSKAMFPPTPPAKCSSSSAWPPVKVMLRSCSSSSHRRPPLSQSRYMSRISFVVWYNCCEYRLSTVVVPMLFWSHDTQYRFPFLWSTFIRQATKKRAEQSVVADLLCHMTFRPNCLKGETINLFFSCYHVTNIIP